MPKPINSPDGKLQITYQSGIYPIMGPTRVRGKVKNISTENADAEIKVDFYDALDKLRGSSMKVLKDMKPGEIRSFDIGNEWSHSMTEVDYHKIYFVKKA